MNKIEDAKMDAKRWRSKTINQGRREIGN
jgi:hypothetical protein